MSDVSIIIPAYNESGGIQPVITEVQSCLERSGHTFEIIVVDDGSADGTGEQAKSAGARVITHATNLGYGASLKTGIRRASFDLIIITDADGTYPAERIPDLIEAMDETDMAVGARTTENVHIPLSRKPAKWCLRKLAGYLTRHPIPDLNSGLRCFRKDIVEGYMHLLPDGFSFTTTITIAHHCDNRLVRYIPVDYEIRTGTSKIRPIHDT